MLGVRFNAHMHTRTHTQMMWHPTTKSPAMELILLLLLDVAHGLEYLHAKGIVHGDLKPDNVLLKADVSSALGIVAKLSGAT